MSKSLREFFHGDEVEAKALPFVGGKGNIVRGSLNSMNCGMGDELLGACVMREDGLNVAVYPKSIRYAVDSNGFSFQVDARNGSVTVRRNDNKILDRRWMQRWGVRKLAESMSGRAK